MASRPSCELEVDCALVLRPCFEVGKLKAFERCRGQGELPFLFGDELVNCLGDGHMKDLLVRKSGRNPKNKLVFAGIQVSDMAGQNLALIPLQ